MYVPIYLTKQILWHKNNTLSAPRPCFQLYLLSEEAARKRILKQSADHTSSISNRKVKTLPAA